MAAKPRCYNCRHYQASPLSGQGWCRNPLLHQERERSLVEANRLSCDKHFYNYWEPRDGDEPLPPRTPPRWTILRRLPSLNPSQAVYYYAIAGILVILGIAIVLLLPTAGSSSASARGDSGAASAATATAATSAAGAAATPGAAPAGGAAPISVVIGNTGGDGACIRKEPSKGAQCLVARPDGTSLKLTGQETQAEDRLWRAVEDDKGTAGWVPAEYLLGVAPTPASR